MVYLLNMVIFPLRYVITQMVIHAFLPLKCVVFRCQTPWSRWRASCVASACWCSATFRCIWPWRPWRALGPMAVRGRDAMCWIYIELSSGWLVVLEHGWIMTFHILGIMNNNDPNWRTHIFQRGRYTTNQIIYGDVPQNSANDLLDFWGCSNLC